MKVGFKCKSVCVRVMSALFAVAFFSVFINAQTTIYFHLMSFGKLNCISLYPHLLQVPNDVVSCPGSPRKTF